MTATFKKKDHAPIIFNNVTLADVKSHKHLGLVLASNLSWTEHISSIIKSVSPMASVMKNLKYQLDRKSLETTYFSFLRPKLEYCCHVWDNCTNRESETLENFQLDIARTVTGARKGTSHEQLYRETNWPTLHQRRQAVKLKKFIKIAHHETPNYLIEMLPDKVGEIRPGSRHADNFRLMKTRTETFKKSFIPSSIKTWNSLDPQERTINYAKSLSRSKPNILFYDGSRDVNVKHSQLRMKCSKLNFHLFLLHVVDSPACSCGFNTEDSKHYLLNCPLYNVERQNMFHSLLTILNANDINENILLFGSADYELKINKTIFKAVHTFISDSKRL